MDRFDGATWRKSTRSGGNDNCVEVAVARDGGRIGVRDSKAGPAGPVLDFASVAFAAFLADVRAGRLAPDTTG